MRKFSKFWSALAQLILIFCENSFQRNLTKHSIAKIQLKQFDMLCTQALKAGRENSIRNLQYITRTWFIWGMYSFRYVIVQWFSLIYRTLWHWTKRQLQWVIAAPIFTKTLSCLPLWSLSQKKQILDRFLPGKFSKKSNVKDTLGCKKLDWQIKFVMIITLLVRKFQEIWRI